MDSLKVVSICALVAIGGLSLLLFLQPVQPEHVHAESISTDGPGQIRTYYISADEVDWDYAPTGINQVTGKPFDEVAQTYVKNDSDRIGHVYTKAVYREYTDGTFTKLKPVSEKWKHLGILGPAIHAEVGDTIKINFKNNARFPFSIHPHGVFYEKDSEGAPYDDSTNKSGSIVAPGGNYTYIWQVPERAGPGPHDPSSIVWMYHSHVNEVKDTLAGLVGPIIITRHGYANPDGTPKDVDQEFVTLFTIYDENNSPYLDYNIKRFAQVPSSVDVNDDGFVESNKKHSINGYLFGNLPGLEMKSLTHVRWYVLGMGTETDIHTPHWHGQTLLMDGMRTDMVELLPMSMKVLDMYPDNTGTWLYHCHVNDHLTAGMIALFSVK